MGRRGRWIARPRDGKRWNLESEGGELRRAIGKKEKEQPTPELTDPGTDRPFVGINKWKGKFCQFVKDFEAISVEIELWFVFILK